MDDRLTICVHETRRSSVINALLKSTWDHDKFFHQADDLSAIILVDTPGGGDPKIRTDIVYNFLPICDTIVYFFNATNPLNINDLPILRELNQVLQHTDFFYVYSRADNVFKLQDTAWKRRVLMVGFAGVAAITLGISIWYQLGVVSAPQSWGEAVIWGAAGNAAWAALVLCYRKFSSVNADWIVRSQKATLRAATLGALGRLYNWTFHEPEEISAAESVSVKFLEERVSEIVSSNIIQLRARNEVVAKNIEAARTKGLTVINAYREAWENGRKIIEELYHETDEKIRRFKAVSTGFKERTIDRTRQLFGDRRAELDQYIQQLQHFVDVLSEIH